MKNRHSSGFTLLELLIVFSISVILTTLFIGFSKQNESTLALSSEQLKLANAFSNAKALAIQTFIEDFTSQRVCGYGLHFKNDKRTYVVFRDLPEPRNGLCLVSESYTGNRRYDSGSTDELVSENLLSGNIRFTEQLVSDIVFLPPEPKIFFTPDVGSETTFTIKAGNDEAARSVKVTKAGQITAL